ncbi:EF Tu GTP binding domain-containing protein [Gautieria morchelliformis]|nr:EF Tu GTP binding domain-containing protein [Gautieria morchelliformis]
MDQQQFDMASLNLQNNPDAFEEEPPKMTLAREKVLQQAREALQGDSKGKRGISLVVIGHVDAGKSTLMGRVLYELGRVDQKRRIANERASGKLGKGSFSWAWELDGTIEERQRCATESRNARVHFLSKPTRGVTMDIALQNFSTSSRNITVLDAPGHRDFIPNMISGASQADCALLVVDASSGEFEAGFDRGGQTREHLLLVRSLGVSQVVVAVNKLDQVDWDRERYEKIVEDLRPFLLQSGFLASKTKFVPVSAIAGVNLVNQASNFTALSTWYNGTTLVDLLDELDPPVRSLDSPLRVPISNVFKGQTALSSGLGVSGRVCSGVIQVGERLRVLPGDEYTVVRLIEQDEGSAEWAAAGSNVTLYLSAIDPIHLSIGTVLCPPTELVPLVTKFVAQVIIFDIDLPITVGASVELFHHSRDVPATLSRLIATLDRATSVVLKPNPRVLAKLASAKVEVTLRGNTINGPSAQVSPIPLETFKTNKEMGRVLLRRGGETIAAGIVIELL